jgi:hypothetical protein
MRVASEISEADIKRREVEHRRDRAGQQMRLALRYLAANLMRITRGAGAPEDLVLQMTEFLEAFHAYCEAADISPSPFTIREMLDISIDNGVLVDMSYPEQTKAEGEEAILRGSLQIAASRLVWQRLQERAGEDETHRGLELLKEAREAREEERRQERLEERRAAKAGVLPRHIARDIKGPEGFLKPRRKPKADPA